MRLANLLERFAGRCALAIALLLVVAGCYETAEEIFDARSAVAIPGLEGRYVYGDTAYTISHPASGNDYAFLETTASPPESGTFRAIPAGGDVYLVQMHRDKWAPDVFLQLVFRIARSGDKIRELQQVSVSDKIVRAQAERNGVVLPKEGEKSDSRTGGGASLNGSREGIAAFLRALAAGPFDHADIYTRAD
jgi:hypothetical protein